MSFERIEQILFVEHVHCGGGDMWMVLEGPRIQTNMWKHFKDPLLKVLVWTKTG